MSKEVLLYAAAFVALAAVICVGVVLLAGVSEVRQPSDYTGNVVDIENEKGIIFRTTQAHVKTDRRSSEHETFCVHPDNREQLDTLRDGLQTDNRVTIEYSRPLYVPVWVCQSGTAIIDEVTIHE